MLPLILGMRVPLDTLLVVAEAAWCFSEKHSAAVAAHCEESWQQQVWCPPAPPRPVHRNAREAVIGDADTAPVGAQPQEPVRGRKRRGHSGARPSRHAEPTSAQPSFNQRWYPERRRRPGIVPGDSAGPMLQDVVFFGNVASFYNHGDFARLSWNGNKAERAGYPGWGMTVIAITVHGAQLMTGWMEHAEPGHLDVRLSDALTRGSFDAERSGDGALSELQRVASYAWNAFGGYHQRISACHFNKNQERRCSWKPPIQPWRSKLNKAVVSNASRNAGAFSLRLRARRRPTDLRASSRSSTAARVTGSPSFRQRS